MNILSYHKGDLLDAFDAKEVNVIIHQCNCFNNFGRGIAKAIKERYPEAYEADCRTEKGDQHKLGRWSSASCNGGLVFNAYGQYRYGGGVQQTSYSSLREALTSITTHLSDRNKLYISGGKEWVIGVPKIGCGLGGGDWNVVGGIIKSTLLTVGDVRVYDL